MNVREKHQNACHIGGLSLFYQFRHSCGEVTELAEGARLLSEWRPQTAPGFESLPLRHFTSEIETSTAKNPQ